MMDAHTRQPAPPPYGQKKYEASQLPRVGGVSISMAPHQTHHFSANNIQPLQRGVFSRLPKTTKVIFILFFSTIITGLALTVGILAVKLKTTSMLLHEAQQKECHPITITSKVKTVMTTTVTVTPTPTSVSDGFEADPNLI
ncbi:hypothetical protein BJ508DRAFT_417105, partial [Ascobolus immersus RN42]